jgi:hypothetical protein
LSSGRLFLDALLGILKFTLFGKLPIEIRLSGLCYFLLQDLSKSWKARNKIPRNYLWNIYILDRIQGDTCNPRR